jgi:hypothetical protein
VRKIGVCQGRTLCVLRAVASSFLGSPIVRITCASNQQADRSVGRSSRKDRSGSLASKEEESASEQAVGRKVTKGTNKLVEEYTASIGFDKALAEEDVQGSLAHVTMLGKCGILPQEDVETIKAGLARYWIKSVRERLFSRYRMKIFI